MKSKRRAFGNAGVHRASVAGRTVSAAGCRRGAGGGGSPQHPVGKKSIAKNILATLGDITLDQASVGRIKAFLNRGRSRRANSPLQLRKMDFLQVSELGAIYMVSQHEAGEFEAVSEGIAIFSAFAGKSSWYMPLAGRGKVAQQVPTALPLTPLEVEPSLLKDAAVRLIREYAEVASPWAEASIRDLSCRNRPAARRAMRVANRILKADVATLPTLVLRLADEMSQNPEVMGSDPVIGDLLHMCAMLQGAIEAEVQP